MRALVTGATGFAGQWLVRELERAGHDVVAAPSSSELDVADVAAIEEWVHAAAPDVIAHLAAISSATQAASDLERAVRTVIGGTFAITNAAVHARRPPGLLLVSSAEVYAPPTDDRPITEDSPVHPRRSYGHLKLAQESVALAAACRDGLPVVVLRPFNHAGPGQRDGAAVAAFARRLAAVQRGEARTLKVGSLDVERDVGDVRDVVVAYRLTLELLAEGKIGRPPSLFNVATGVPVRMRDIVNELCRIARVVPVIEVDAGLVREDDPPRVVGDAGALRRATAWEPRIDLSQTLADVLGELEARTGGRG